MNEKLCHGSAHGTAECSVPRVSIPLSEFRDSLDDAVISNSRNVQWCQGMARYFPVLFVSYEDLNENTKETLSRIQDFLGLPSAPLSSKFIKDTGGIIGDKVTNLEALKREYVSWLTISPAAAEPLADVH